MSRQKLFRVVEIMGGWENARKYLNLHVRVFHCQWRTLDHFRKGVFGRGGRSFAMMMM